VQINTRTIQKRLGSVQITLLLSRQRSPMFFV